MDLAIILHTHGDTHTQRPLGHTHTDPCSLLQVEFHSSVAGVFCGELKLSVLIV